MNVVVAEDSTLICFCFSVQHKMEREWGLSILEEGVRDKQCYELCEKQGIYQTLLGFGSTPLCDPASQVRSKLLLSVYIYTTT